MRSEGAELGRSPLSRLRMLSQSSTTPDSPRRRIGRGLLPILLAGCVVHLPSPEGSVSCATTRDCPKPLLCAPLVQRCVAALLTEAPTLVSVAATDAETVAVTTSAIPSPALLADPSRFSISDATGTTLTVLSVSGRGTAFSLTTAPQAAAVSYTLAFHLDDVQGNATDTRATFIGYGGQPNTGAPLPVLPADAQTLAFTTASASVTLAWDPVEGALLYTIDVATDAAFGSPIAGSPFTSVTPSLGITLSDSREYFWRVRGDITGAGVFGSASFSVLLGAVDVYCAADSDCSGAAGEERGDASYPFRSVARALISAEALGLPLIRIAARGNGEAYDDLLLFASAGFTLNGGYGSDFNDATRDPVANPTLIATETTVLNVLDVETPLVVDGLQLEALTSPTPATDQLITVNIGRTNADVTFSRCTITTAAGANNSEAVQVSAIGNGTVHFTNGSVIHVYQPLTFALAVVVLAGNVDMDATSIVADGDPSGNSGAVIALGQLGASTVSFTNGSALSNGSDGGSTIDQIAGTFSASHATFLRSSHSADDVIVDQLDAGTQFFDSSILAFSDSPNTTDSIDLEVQGGTVTATNSIILSTPANYAFAVQVLTGSATLVHDTIFCANGGAASYVFASESGSIATNNILVCGSGTSKTSAVEEAHFGDSPSSMQNNVFVGCFTDYFAGPTPPGTALSDAAAVNALDTCPGCTGVRFTNNADAALAASALFVAPFDSNGVPSPTGDFHLTTAGAAAMPAGKPTSGSDCGTYPDPVSCGSITIDFDGHTRSSTAPTPGAFEAP